MYNSIQYFLEKDIIKIEKFLGELISGKKNLEDFIETVQSLSQNMIQNLIGEMFEKLDREILESPMRKKKYHIERKNEPKQILTLAGEISFKRTGYTDKNTGKYEYLLDNVLGITPHQRMTIDVAAKVLEESIETSYAKGGRDIGNGYQVSKQAVKNLVHNTVIELPQKEKLKKKQVKTLQIVADEDHVAAQFWKTKGDLSKDSQGRKINTIMPKLIVVYEDVINESGATSKNPRYKLIGKKVFSGVAKGNSENYEMWDNVRKYIDQTYDTEAIERIYISGDGAAWIKQGCEVLEKSVFVLDRFHMMKYVNISTAHLWDSVEDVRCVIWQCLNTADKNGLRDVFRKILSVTELDSKRTEVESSLKYFLNNWMGIEIYSKDTNARKKCCAEGQVSHILSARLSSRPLGWSERGCDQMSKFRAIHANKEKVIDILKYQKKKQNKEGIIKVQASFRKEVRKQYVAQKYAEKVTVNIPGLESRNLKWLRELINGEVV